MAPSPIAVNETGYGTELVGGRNEVVGVMMVEGAVVGKVNVDALSDFAVDPPSGEEDDTVGGSTGSGELSLPIAWMMAARAIKRPTVTTSSFEWFGDTSFRVKITALKQWHTQVFVEGFVTSVAAWDLRSKGGRNSTSTSTRSHPISRRCHRFRFHSVSCGTLLHEIVSRDGCRCHKGRISALR